MDAQFTPRDGKAQVSFYRHQQRIEPTGLKYASSLYRERMDHNQVPLNFYGRHTLRAPGDDSAVFDPRPLAGYWHAEQHIPVMRTQPVTAKMH